MLLLQMRQKSPSLKKLYPLPTQPKAILTLTLWSGDITMEIEGEDHIGYRLDLAMDTLFSSILGSYDNILMEDSILEATGLEPSTSYSIRVTAIGQYGSTDRVIFKNIVTTDTPEPPLRNGND